MKSRLVAATFALLFVSASLGAGTAGAQTSPVTSRPAPIMGMQTSQGTDNDRTTRDSFISGDGSVKRMAAAALRPTERGTVHLAHTMDGQDDSELGR
ncbi:hypothetical protein SAMN05216548_11613 [Faunimonas pinastri]|uniref:Uncharacterized protein n=1 Tax=Faunimonas pinastri TaxID=1855383 RepID=A0A1H9NGU0_9HYPH|nr:hypothetical protein [Faunimonas pinastri]SER35204.1 hypothetical protein SAMN05216548_11613 [Faunimonas pinastri]